MRLTAVVRGRVQGVGFRFFVHRQADMLGLVGTATNLPDGSVEVVAEGSHAAAEALVTLLRSEDAPGIVGGVDVSWSAASGEFRAFREL
jgi:acylphosphatase